MVFSPSADVFVVRPQDKDIRRGGEYHRLRVQFRPPDDGLVRPETCRGKKIADIVRRQKSSVSSWKQRINYTEMHGQQNIKIMRGLISFCV